MQPELCAVFASLVVEHIQWLPSLLTDSSLQNGVFDIIMSSTPALSISLSLPRLYTLPSTRPSADYITYMYMNMCMYVYVQLLTRNCNTAHISLQCTAYTLYMSMSNGSTHDHMHYFVVSHSCSFQTLLCHSVCEFCLPVGKHTTLKSTRC